MQTLRPPPQTHSTSSLFEGMKLLGSALSCEASLETEGWCSSQDVLSLQPKGNKGISPWFTKESWNTLRAKATPNAHPALRTCGASGASHEEKKALSWKRPASPTPDLHRPPPSSAARLEHPPRSPLSLGMRTDALPPAVPPQGTATPLFLCTGTSLSVLNTLRGYLSHSWTRPALQKGWDNR